MKKLLLFSFILTLILVIKEAQAATTPTNPVATNTNNLPVDDKIQYLRLQLAKDAINKDETIVYFKRDANVKYEPGSDAVYFQGFGQVNLSSQSSDRIALTLNIQPLPKASVTIGLNVNVKTDGRYQLNMTELVAIPQLFDIWLMDAFTNDSLDMRHNATYSFNVSKIDNSTFGSKRFTLVIRQNPGYACHLLSFAANKVTNTKQVDVAWSTENEQDYTQYTVERSIDNGKTFDSLNALTTDGKGAYSFTDKNAATGQNLYRLKQEDINNAVTYSTAIQVFFSNMDTGLSSGSTGVSFSIYPNPTSNVINIAMGAKLPATAYDITITNINGFQVRQGTTTEASWASEISNLQTGVYLIRVTNNKDKSLVGLSKFSKN